MPYTRYGPEAVEAQAALNRPAFVNELAAAWLPAIPDVLARLQDDKNPARVADVGCGVGWASIELAKAFPNVRVDGYDVDEDSISRARRNAAEAGSPCQGSSSACTAPMLPTPDPPYSVESVLTISSQVPADGRPMR